MVAGVSCDAYFTDLEMDSPPDYSPRFLRRIRKLPKSLKGRRNEMKYLDFIEDYGTHFNIRAEFGGWRGQLSVFTKEDYQQLKSGIIPINTKAEISCKEIFIIVLFYQTFWPDANFHFQY